MSWFASLKQQAAHLAAVVSSEVQKASEELMAESPTDIGNREADAGGSPDGSASATGAGGGGGGASGAVVLPWQGLTGVLQGHEDRVKAVILSLSRDIETFTEGVDAVDRGSRGDGDEEDGGGGAAVAVDPRTEFGKDSFDFTRTRVRVAKALMAADPLLRRRRFAIVRPRSAAATGGLHRTEREFWANYFFHVDAVLRELRSGLAAAAAGPGKSSFSSSGGGGDDDGDSAQRQEHVFRRVLARLESCSVPGGAAVSATDEAPSAVAGGTTTAPALPAAAGAAAAAAAAVGADESAAPASGRDPHQPSPAVPVAPASGGSGSGSGRAVAPARASAGDAGAAGGAGGRAADGGRGDDLEPLADESFLSMDLGAAGAVGDDDSSDDLDAARGDIGFGRLDGGGGGGGGDDDDDDDENDVSSFEFVSEMQGFDGTGAEGTVSEEQEGDMRSALRKDLGL